MPDDADVATVKGNIPVQGTCRAGHTTTGTSAKGRVTAEGPCSHPGCDLTVKMRRAPTSKPATKNEPAPEKPSEKATPAGRFKPIEVTYEQPARGQQHRADDESGPEQQPAGAGDSDRGPVDVVQPGEHHSHEQPRKPSGRWKRRRPKLDREQRAAARAAIDAEWIIPGVLHR